MTVKELQKKQNEMFEIIRQHAQNAGLIKQKPIIEPIYDGVTDIEGYLASNPKIMWILKEPYDDFTQSGKYRGGDWYFTEHFKKKDVWKDETMWKVMIQINYAIRNGLKWKELDYIENDPEMIEELKKIAYINISKMPGESESTDHKLFESYKIWKDIIKEQIDLYKPELIIFGKTFQFFKDDFFHITEKPIKTVSGKWYSELYKKDGMILIDAFHPSRKGGEDTSSEYVNSIINAYKKVKDIK